MKNSKNLSDLLIRLDVVKDLFSSRKFQPKSKSIKREICHRYGMLVRLHLSSDSYTVDEDAQLISEVSLFIDHLGIE